MRSKRRIKLTKKAAKRKKQERKGGRGKRITKGSLRNRNSLRAFLQLFLFFLFAFLTLLFWGVFTPSCAPHTVAKVSTSGSFSASWTPERCQYLLDQRDALMWAVAFGGGLAGAGGISTAIPEDAQRGARVSLGITSAVIAAATSSLVVLAKSKSEEFEQYCNVEEMDPVIHAEIITDDDVDYIPREPIDADFVEIKPLERFPLEDAGVDAN